MTIKNRLTDLRCWLTGHKWTSHAIKGIPPTKHQLDEWNVNRNLSGFFEYALLYCDRCGKVYEQSLLELARSRSNIPYRQDDKSS